MWGKWQWIIIITLHTYIVSTVTYIIAIIYLMEEEDIHDKPKAYRSFNSRSWIADKLKMIKYAEEIVFMLHLIYMAYQGRQYDIGFNNKKSNESS